MTADAKFSVGLTQDGMGVVLHHTMTAPGVGVVETMIVFPLDGARKLASALDKVANTRAIQVVPGAAMPPNGLQ